MKKSFMTCSKGMLFFLTAFLIATTGLAKDQANSDLFTVVSKSDLRLSPSQSAKIDRMLANPIYLTHFYMEVGELSSLHQNEAILVNLPDKEEGFSFNTRHLNYHSSDDYEYFAEFVPCDESDLSYGYISLVAKAGDLFGQINYNEEIYELYDLGARKNVLLKVDPSIYTKSECMLDTTSIESDTTEVFPAGFRESTAICNFPSGGCNIRVLVLYTDAAAQVGNPENRAHLLMSQTNLAAQNSEAEVWFTLAAVEPLTNFNEIPQSISATLGNVTNSNYIAGRRTATDADLVVLLSDGNWFVTNDDGSESQIFGISSIGQTGDPATGFAVVVELDAAGGRYTFSHELAHNLGCKHDSDDFVGGLIPLSARGHIIKKGGERFPTVMADIVGGEARIVHYSNPEVEFKNKKTGKDDKDNATQLSNLSCAIAAYIEEEPLGAEIAGPDYGYGGEKYTWCPDICNCSGDYTLFWERSSDGIQYYPLTNVSDECATWNLPLLAHLYLRLTVQCEDGQIFKVFQRVKNFDFKKPCDDIFDTGLVNQPSTEQLSLSLTQDNPLMVLPNPSNKEINIHYRVAQIADVDMAIYNLSGQKSMQIIQSNQKPGTYTESRANASKYC